MTGWTRSATTPRTAEMIKYTANSLLATMISFSNEIANLADAIGGIDVVSKSCAACISTSASRPILPDGRGFVPAFTTYLEAGCGFGGSCFPKDVKALIAHGRKAGSPMRLLTQVVEVNACQPARLIGLIQRHHPKLKDLPVSVLGVAFKPGTDDIRESPALPVLDILLKEGARVTVFDPIATPPLRGGLPGPAHHLCPSVDGGGAGSGSVGAHDPVGRIQGSPETHCEARAPTARDRWPPDARTRLRAAL